MKPAPFELRRPATLDEALDQLAALGSDARILAGGQSLLPMLRFRVVQAHVLLDINRLDALAGVQGDAELSIGALVRHADLEKLPGGRPVADLIRTWARAIAFWAVRNRGTAVGSVALADPKGDWPLLMAALDARIELTGRRGARSMPVRTFITGALETARAVDELATRLTLGADEADITRWGRSKLVHRAGEYADCSAVVLQRRGRWSCWVGGAGDTPVELATVGRALDAGDGARGHDHLTEAALADLEDLGAVPHAAERMRHAVNAADAAMNAWAQPA